MSMLRGRGGSRGAFPQLMLVLAVLAGCASAEPAPAEREGFQPSDSCEYRKVFIDFDNSSEGSDPRVELLRVAILNHALELLGELGLETVVDPSEAYWRLFADAWMDGQRNPLVHLGLSGTLKLGRHLFVVAMADETFPFRGGTGGSYNFAGASVADAQLLGSQVETGMRWIWRLDSEQIAALCAIRSELIDEGWVAIEELRNELIEEMEQIRRARARANVQKALELEVEGNGQPERVE